MFRIFQSVTELYLRLSSPTEAGLRGQNGEVGEGEGRKLLGGRATHQGGDAEAGPKRGLADLMTIKNTYFMSGCVGLTELEFDLNTVNPKGSRSNSGDSDGLGSIGQGRLGAPGSIGRAERIDLRVIV